jgi:PKD repeat protein
VPPVVNAGPDQEKIAGDEVTFAGSFADPSSPSHAVGWDFGDGSAPVIGTLTPKHVFTKSGVYTVKLIVTDNQLASGSDTLIVTVISSYGSISEALERLKPFVKESKRIEKIAKDLTASLEPKYWVDEVHLTPKGGNKAFVYWRQSADMMEQLLKPSKKRTSDPQDANDGEDDDEFKKIFNDPKNDTLSAAAIKVVGLSLSDVIRASRLISETLFLENEGLQALDPRKQKRVDAALARGQEYLEEANEWVAKGDYGTTVRRYIRSWNNTQDAIDIAAQSQPVKELAKAQDLIEESLDPKNWVDEMHLHVQTGAKTFNLMQSAARELANVVVDAQKGRVVAAVGKTAEAELAHLLARARSVSRTSYIENAQLVAGKPSNQKAVENDLKRAKEDLDKGLAAEAAGDSDKALNHYASAWDATKSALEKAVKN